MAASGVIFFAYIGFDAISTAAQETRNPAARHADRYPGEPGHLHDPLRGRTAIVLTGMVSYKELDVPPLSRWPSISTLPCTGWACPSSWAPLRE